MASWITLGRGVDDSVVAPADKGADEVPKGDDDVYGVLMVVSRYCVAWASA
jgi:hypothetical protein